MRSFDLYKHENCTDVAIMPLKIYRVNPEYIKVKLRWFSVHGNQLSKSIPPFDLGVTETHKINIKDLAKWRLYEVR